MGVQVGVLTEEQLEQVWNDQGLETKLKRFHKFLLERGLLPMSVPEYLFLGHIKNSILHDFFVKGVRIDEKGRTRYGSD